MPGPRPRPSWRSTERNASPNRAEVYSAPPSASVEAMTNSYPDERSMRERMLAGDLYLADDPQLAAESDRA